MVQLQLQWSYMNKELRERKLLNYGQIIKDEQYFLKLGNRLANLYIRHFKNIINNIDFNNLRLEETILDFDQYILIPEDEKYLKFKPINRLVLAPNSYIEFDLRFMVTDLCLYKVRRKIAYNMTLEEALNIIRANYKFKSLELNLKLVMDKLYLISLAYGYTYDLLEEKNVFMAGMFKNAYYDIIMLGEKIDFRQDSLNTEETRENKTFTSRK